MSSRRQRAVRRPPPRQPSILSRRVGPLPGWSLGLATLALVAVVGVAIANSLSGAGDRPLAYVVGSPGVGAQAPDFDLPGVAGERYRLSARRGQNVLLFFHEGLGCAPCWQQVGDLQRDLDQFIGLGVAEVVAISVDPLAAQSQHAQAIGVTLPILADEDRSVSQAYDALSYSMMGGATPGHTFILVGPDGVIRWRADYGGPPTFTMYVPDDVLLAELSTVLRD